LGGRVRMTSQRCSATRRIAQNEAEHWGDYEAEP
jgi:hypothetical protein